MMPQIICEKNAGKYEKTGMQVYFVFPFSIFRKFFVFFFVFFAKTVELIFANVVG